MKLSKVFSGSIPKEDEPGATNEDAVLWDEAAQRFVVADGASESYDSGSWSRLLAQLWITGGRRSMAPGVPKSIQTYERGCNPEALSWSRRSAYERGSFSTLLGVSVSVGVASVFAIGDSIVVGSFIGGEAGSMSCFPYDNALEFDQRPLLISTNMHQNVEVFPVNTKVVCRKWRLVEGSTLLLMTDALGQWLLRQENRQSARDTLSGFQDEEEFRTFVIAERASGAMRRDDTTLLHLRAGAT